MIKSSTAGKKGTPSSVCTVTLRENSFSSTVTLATVIFIVIEEDEMIGRRVKMRRS
jgi:hypothetical protein